MLEIALDVENLIKNSGLPEEEKQQLLDYAKGFDSIWQDYKAATEPAFQKFQKQREQVGFDAAWSEYRALREAEEKKAYRAANTLGAEIKQRLGILNTSDQK